MLILLGNIYQYWLLITCKTILSLQLQKYAQNKQCVKSVRIRSYSVPYSVRMRENTDQNIKFNIDHFSLTFVHL